LIPDRTGILLRHLGMHTGYDLSSTEKKRGKKAPPTLCASEKSSLKLHINTFSGDIFERPFFMHGAYMECRYCTCQFSHTHSQSPENPSS